MFTWPLNAIIVIGALAVIVAALMYGTYRMEKLNRQPPAQKRPAPKPTSREFLDSLDVRRLDLRSNLIQMFRRYEDLEKEIAAISLEEDGTRELLAAKVHEKAELGEEIAKIKAEITKVNKFIREMRAHFSGKQERETSTSN